MRRPPTPCDDLREATLPPSASTTATPRPRTTACTQGTSAEAAAVGRRRRRRDTTAVAVCRLISNSAECPAREAARWALGEDLLLLCDLCRRTGVAGVGRAAGPSTSW